MNKKRCLIPIVLFVGAAGGGTGYGMIPDFRFALITFGAACIAGMLVAVLFGRGGVKGWGMAFLAGVLATFGASTAIGLFLNSSAKFDAPALVFLQVAEHPMALIWWLVTMGGAHLTARSLRGVSKQ